MTLNLTRTTVCGALVAVSVALGGSGPTAAQGLSPKNALMSQGITAADASRELAVAQRLLKRLGLLDEQPTGIMTPQSEEALRVFARNNGIAFNPQVDEEMLRVLRRVAWQSGGWKTGSAKGQDKVLDAAGVKEAQGYLLQLGYVPGPVDGTFGPQTQSAVESFQESQMVGVDGLVTTTSLANLKRALVLKPSEIVGTLRILNWSDYIDPALLDEFERQTHINVIYDVFASGEELEAKLKTSSAPYDLVVPTASNIRHLAESELLQPIQKDKLKNASNLDDEIMAYTDSYDRGNKNNITYMWGTIGVASNKTLVDKYAPGLSVDSLKAILDPASAKQLGACGVRVIDSPSDVIPLVLRYIGIAPTTNDPAMIAKAGPALQAVKAWVRPISSEDYIDALAKGKICATLAYSGDAIQARKTAKAPNIVQYYIPVEGSSLWFDTFAISARAPNLPAAYAFLDFMLKPENIAKSTNYISYANGNAKSGPFIHKEILQDPGIYPPPQVMNKLFTDSSPTPEAIAAMNKVWEMFKN